MAYNTESILSRCLVELKIEDSAGHSFTVQPLVLDSLTLSDLDPRQRKSKKNIISGKILDIKDSDVYLLRDILSKLRASKLKDIDKNSVWVSTNRLPGGGCDMLDFTLTGIDAQNNTHVIYLGANTIDTFNMGLPLSRDVNFSITLLGVQLNTYAKS